MARLERVPGVVVFVAVAALYVALAQYVIWLNDPIRHGAGFWPANGVTLAALLLLPRRRWWIVLLAVVAAELLVDTVLNDYPLIPSSWWAAANTLEPTAAALLLHRAGSRHQLTPLRNLMSFLALAVCAAPALGGLVGSTGTTAEYGGDWASVWAKFSIGDALGILTVTPLLLAPAQPKGSHRTSRLETGLLAGSTAALAGVQVMQLPGQLEIVLPYLIIPVLIWAGMRFGVAATATCGFVLANAANAANALGHGASALDVSDGHAITLIQIFIGIGLTTGLVVAALSHELASEVAARTVLAHLAGHDHLTGLPNRKLLLERTRAALDAPNGPGASVGVLYVDLDGFKSINDRLGHAVGDLVLTEVARRLDQGSRPGDTVARVGGDEFIVLCPEISDEHQLAELAERLARLASEPFTYEGQQLDIRASIGTALAADPTVSPHDLIEASDRAMYQAKREQRLLHEHASSASIHPG